MCGRWHTRHGQRQGCLLVPASPRLSEPQRAVGRQRQGEREGGMERGRGGREGEKKVNCTSQLAVDKRKS